MKGFIRVSKNGATVAGTSAFSRLPLRASCPAQQTVRVVPGNVWAAGASGSAGLLVARRQFASSACEAPKTGAVIKGKLLETTETALRGAFDDTKYGDGFFKNIMPKDLDLKNCEIELYQFESCPFCRKARVCLDYLKIPYKVVEVHPLNKKELKFSPDYKKVPQLVIRKKGSTEDPVILRDSKLIVHSLLVHHGKSPASMAGRKDVEEERRWIKWSDEVLVQLIVMNIYRTWKESSETFDYLLTHPMFTWFEKKGAHFAGTAVMWVVSSQRKKKYEITDERAALYEVIADFVNAVGEKKFLGGDKPNQADIAVYGILRSTEGFTSEEDIFANTKIKRWHSDMMSVVGDSSSLNKIARGPSAK